MVAWKVETQKKKVIQEEGEMKFYDRSDYNGSREYKL